MTELLKRWASLEPAWCGVDDERASVMTDVGTPLERPRFTAQFHRLGQYEPHILAAVIEAIEARGWLWSVGTVTSRPRIWAFVNRDRHGWGCSGKADYPAEALLAAYLAALEAEGNQ